MLTANCFSSHVQRDSATATATVATDACCGASCGTDGCFFRVALPTHYSAELRITDALCASTASVSLQTLATGPATVGPSTFVALYRKCFRMGVCSLSGCTRPSLLHSTSLRDAFATP